MFSISLSISFIEYLLPSILDFIVGLLITFFVKGGIKLINEK